MNEWPCVSILIASKNRRADLERCLETVRRLDYPADRMEVVVVEETDNPKPIPGVQYFPLPMRHLGFGYARNQCVRHARYPLLAFTDDDCLLAPDWLQELVRPLTPNIGGVAGAVKVQNPGVIGFCESVLGFPGGGLKMIWKSRGKMVPTTQLSTCNCLYRREILQEVGLFKEKTIFSGEDYDLAQRVVRRARCLYNPKAVVYHRPRGRFPEIFKWFYRRGRSEVNLIRLRTHSNAWQVAHILFTSLTLRVLAAWALLAYFGLPVFWGLGFLAFLYYAVNLARTAFQLKMGGTWKTWLLTPVVKLVMDLGWDWGKFRAALASL